MNVTNFSAFTSIAFNLYKVNEMRIVRIRQHVIQATTDVRADAVKARINVAGNKFLGDYCATKKSFDPEGSV